MAKRVDVDFCGQNSFSTVRKLRGFDRSQLRLDLDPPNYVRRVDKILGTVLSSRPPAFKNIKR